MISHLVDARAHRDAARAVGVLDEQRVVGDEDQVGFGVDGLEDVGDLDVLDH